MSTTKLAFTDADASGAIGCTTDEQLLEVAQNGRTRVLCPVHAEALTEETQ